MARTVMITTNDNPFDPFDQFKEWYMYDALAGYQTCGYLARIAHVSNQLSDEENSEEIERAIDEIIAHNPEIYQKRVRVA